MNESLSPRRNRRRSAFREVGDYTSAKAYDVGWVVSGGTQSANGIVVPFGIEGVNG